MLLVPQASVLEGVSNVKLTAPHSLVLLAPQVIDGGKVRTVAMVWLQVLVLPQRSVASQVRVATKVLPQPTFVTVPRIVIVTGPQGFKDVGVSKPKSPTPHSLVLFPEQAIAGPWVSTTLIVWVQVLVLPQGSVASQVRVAEKVLPQSTLVIVLKMVTVAGVPQLLVADGVSNRKSAPDPHSTALLPAHRIIGPKLSTLAMVWLHTFVLPQASIATQVRVATNVLPQPRFVTVLRIETIAVPHAFVAIGVSKSTGPIPHSWVLLPRQNIVGGVVDTVAITWLQVFVLPQASTASQVRIATKVLPQVWLVTVLKMRIEFVPHRSVAVGVSNARLAVPHSFVLLAKHVITGFNVSTSAMVWLQVFVWPNSSLATHVRVATNVLPHKKFVTVPKMLTVAVPQTSVTVGSSKARAPPEVHSLVLLTEQWRTGPVLLIVTVVEQVATQPLESVALTKTS
jgi:hypothetical protein